MMAPNKKQILVISAIFLLGYLVFHASTNSSNLSSTVDQGLKVLMQSDNYESQCLRLYNKLRNPDPGLFHDPAPKEPPADMLDEFTQHGQMPIKKWWYINEVYSDSKGDQSKSKRVIKNDEMENLLNKVKTDQPSNYNDHNLNKIMHQYKLVLEKKTLAVIGTGTPWIEAIGLDIGCSKIFTLDYTRCIYENPKLTWLHVNDYLDNALRDNIIEEFDNIASFSSLEHAGLGRYGDPLNPNGDIEGVRQIHCMLKPGGLLFLGLPTNDDGSSHIEFNAHRVYGTARLKILFEGWNLLDKIKDTTGVHTIFVLQKVK